MEGDDLGDTRTDGLQRKAGFRAGEWVHVTAKTSLASNRYGAPVIELRDAVLSPIAAPDRTIIGLR